MIQIHTYNAHLHIWSFWIQSTVYDMNLSVKIILVARKSKVEGFCFIRHAVILGQNIILTLTYIWSSFVSLYLHRRDKETE